MLLKEFYQSMYGKIIVEKIDDKTPVKYKQDGEDKEMSAKAAKRMAKDHPAKIAYDAMVKDGGSTAKKSVNIFDKPADEPADEPKAKPSGDDERQITGPNGLEIDRDEIKDIIMKDPEIQDIIGGDDVYWDDADLVSSKFDDATVASLNVDWQGNVSGEPMTIGDIKQAIKDFSKEQGAAQDARDSQEFEPVENDKDINRMQQGMQQAIGGDDYEDVPDRLVLQGKMKADNGETIIVWKDTDDGMLMGVDAEGNVYEDGEKARYGIGVSTAGNVFGADQNKQRKSDGGGSDSYDANKVHKKGEPISTSDLVGKFKADNPDGFEDEDEQLNDAAYFAIQNYKAVTGDEFTSDDLDYDTPREILDFIEAATGNDDIDYEDLNDALLQAYEMNADYEGENDDKSDSNFKFESYIPKGAFRRIQENYIKKSL
tara:strand:+ start:11763 stop:13046 length:1284 start_codon:yes stop_codon:yes gene_type:complete